MKGISHLVIGTSVSAVVAQNVLGLTGTPFLAATAVGAVASVLPDVDADESLIKTAVRGGNRPIFTNYLFSPSVRRELFGSVIYGIVSAFEISIRALLVILMDITGLIFKHRGVTHGIPAALLLAMVTYVTFFFLHVNLLYTLVFLFGYLSHLLADATTVSGLKLFQPLSQHTFYILPKPFRIYTGYEVSLKELLVVFTVASICLAVLNLYGR